MFTLYRTTILFAFGQKNDTRSLAGDFTPVQHHVRPDPTSGGEEIRTRPEHSPNGAADAS